VNWDIAVIGGGIVGLAAADALLAAGHERVVVLEAERQVSSHQTGHNSGVIHSGLYYKPGSLKAVTCTTGRDAMYAFCESEGVPFRRCGKLVIATRDSELRRLGTLEERGRANGLQGLLRLGPEEIREIEPAVRALAGLWVEETGVVDFGGVGQALARRLARRGGQVLTNTRVLRIRSTDTGVRIGTSQGEIAAQMLVNCAGLQSDRVARLAGVDPGVAIIPFRGEYYVLRPERSDLIRNLIYPVPDPDLPFLGVHFTRRIDGRVEAGPNAVLSLNREGYGRWSVAPRDLGATVGYAGFWRLARRYWRTGIDEVARSLSKRRFTRSLQQLVPDLQEQDLRWGGCGVRAQAVNPAGQLLDDFHIVEGERSVHVVNAPSPAATAALGIGDQIAQRVTRTFASC
jgi:(S)-2-hydroxyglutarate dehydrogenase